MSNALAQVQLSCNKVLFLSCTVLLRVNAHPVTGRQKAFKDSGKKNFVWIDTRKHMVDFINKIFNEKRL